MSKLPTNTMLPLFETFCRKNQVDGKEIEVTICDSPIRVKALTTPKSQEKGYMGAESSPKDDEGLLFVYDDETPLHFWMKDVAFPLDIMFFDSNFKLVDRQRMEPHSGEPDNSIPRYVSKKPARFAVEVRAGWCDDNLKDEPTLKF
jgi:uncharacterized membrane protein (UPF0127 family)